ncbi:olfactory receptor 11A1-like [Engystomops pustulosus]|uniref:olfactory receptor 11A1-like n=1 Tax=Engystomops pustulosus TaxID=76066 RepID=UPI003AFACFC2
MDKYNMHKPDEAGMVFIKNVTSIFLLGFTHLQNFTFSFFSLLVLIFCGTISGNLLIMVLYLVSKTLQSPMYFFITQLSLCDLLVSTDIVPVLLHTVLYGGSTITLISCIIQFVIFVTSELSECLLLSVMSYDRYVAILIVTSYVYIVITILKIPSHTGRHKAFSTCSSHLIVVSVFYGTIIIVYMFPTKGESLTLSKVLALGYTVLTPLLNPIIYTLKNKDFREAFQKLKALLS